MKRIRWRRRQKTVEPMGIWHVFNNMTEDEFAECSLCGHEEHPWIVAGEDVTGVSKVYPEVCPRCLMRMSGKITAEEVDAQASMSKEGAACIGD